jgi:DNA-binding response OmpR family regulator
VDNPPAMAIATETDLVPGSKPLPRAIVVEDDADTLAMLGVVLTRLGVGALPAARHAADQLGTPDLLITDVSLPDGSGLRCAADLKELHGCRTLVMSGHAAPDEGLPPGVDVWMSKPVDLPSLEAAVRRLLLEREGQGGDSRRT